MFSMEVGNFLIFGKIVAITGGGSDRLLPKCIVAYKANRFHRNTTILCKDRCQQGPVK